MERRFFPKLACSRPKLRLADLAAETEATLNTGLAIANPQTIAQTVLVRLFDPNSGSALASTKFSLAANGHVARLLTELFPAVDSIGHMRPKISIDACSDTNCGAAGGSDMVKDLFERGSVEGNQSTIGDYSGVLGRWHARVFDPRNERLVRLMELAVPIWRDRRRSMTSSNAET